MVLINKKTLKFHTWVYRIDIKNLLIILINHFRKSIKKKEVHKTSHLFVKLKSLFLITGVMGGA